MKILNREVFNLYWNNHLQLRSPDKQVIKKYINDSLQYGTTKDRFKVNSNFCDNYDITKF